MGVSKSTALKPSNRGRVDHATRNNWQHLGSLRHHRRASRRDTPSRIRGFKNRGIFQSKSCLDLMWQELSKSKGQFDRFDVTKINFYGELTHEHNLRHFYK